MKTIIDYNFFRTCSTATFITILIGLSLTTKLMAEVPILQPGAPGEPTRVIDSETAIAIANTSYTAADVDFMQGMIIHHYQAFLMSEMATSRTNNQTILDLAGRIDISQQDEISFMENWLLDMSQTVPDPSKSNQMHHHKMMGMATPEQMQQLSQSASTDFDRMYLNLMIKHHEGAIDMVDRLNEYPGSAYDPQLYEFVSDLTNDQAVEIERMNGILIDLSDDPRANLAPGLFDAGVAISNMELIASLKKPVGFFDPDNRLEKGLSNEEDKDEEDEEESSIESSASDQRRPMLSFDNTDMAFSNDLLIAGSYHGFNIYRLEEDGIPKHITSVVCPGGQGDVSVVGNLLILSVQDTRGRLDCGLEGVSPEPSEARFRGLRIVDISNDILSFNIQEAAFVLRNCFKDFPIGTVHIISVDDELSIRNEHLAVKANGHYFVGADNGLFKIGRSALTDVGVDYTTQDTVAFFEDADYPVSVEMTLEFQEIWLMHRGLIRKGY